MDEQAGLAATRRVAGEKQLRRLERFTVHEADNPQQLVGFDSLCRYGAGSKPVATGILLPVDGAQNGTPDAGNSSVSVTTGPVIDWCFEYGDRPAVWIITKAAWYQLCSPSASYSSLYDALQLRLELAVRCASALASDPTAAAGVVRHRVLTGLVAGSNGTPVHPEQLSEAAEFLAAQMAALHQAGALLRQPVPGTSAADVLPFVGWLKQEGAAIAAAPPAKRQRLGDAGQAVVTATKVVSGHQPLLASQPSAVLTSTTAPAPGPSQPSAAATEPSPAPVTSATAAAAAKPAHKLKINFPGSGLKPKIKLKGQILPQLQPPPQDMGSQIQGHPPDGMHRQAQQQGHRPKLKFVMSKGGLKQQEEQTQLQHQESWQFSDAQGGWGPPPLYPAPAVHGAAQHQRPHDTAHCEYYDEPAHIHQQPHHLTARQQQRAAAAAAKQAAVHARATAAAARAEEQARRHQQQMLEMEMKRQAEITADIARGAPPPPTRSFRLPEKFISDLLILWELCQAFGGVLNVPPFSLEQLEAALLPGPLTEEQQQQSAAVTGAAADAEALKQAQEAAAQLAAQLAQAAAAAERAATGEQPAADAVQPGIVSEGAGATAATAAGAAQRPAPAPTLEFQPEQHSAAPVAAAGAQRVDKAVDAALAGPEAVGAGDAGAVRSASVAACLPEQSAAGGGGTPAAQLSLQDAAHSDALAAATSPPTAAAASGDAPTTPDETIAAREPSAPVAEHPTETLEAAAAPAAGEAAAAVAAPAAQQTPSGGLVPSTEQPAPVGAADATGGVTTSCVLLQPGSVDESERADAPTPAAAATASTPSEGAGAKEQQDLQQGSQQPQKDVTGKAVQQQAAALQPHHLQGDLVEVQEHGQQQQTQQQIQHRKQVQMQGQHAAEQPTPSAGAGEQPAVCEAAAVSPSKLETCTTPADQQQPQYQQQGKKELRQAEADGLQEQSILAAVESPAEHTEQTGACHWEPQHNSEQQQGPQQGALQAVGEREQKEGLPQEPVKAEKPSLPQDQGNPQQDHHGQDDMLGQQDMMEHQQQQEELQDLQVQPLQVQSAQLSQQQTDQQQQPSQQQSLTQQQEQCQGQQYQHGQHAGQEQLQSPFAGQPPAPSTTSVGTGQAAASNSVGVASSPAKHKLKMKIKLGGMIKQSSSQIQQSISGVTTAAATASRATAIVEAPATGAAVAETDPVSAAAAGGAGDWKQPAPSDAPNAHATAAAAEEEDEEEQQVDVGITDHLSLTSSVVLRDVHSALLRLVDGTAPKPGKKAPKQPLIGKLCPGDTNQRQLAALMTQPHWAHRAAHAVSAAAGGTLAEPEFKAQDVSNVLLNNDYAVMQLEQRMSVLHCLLELALASETLRAHVDVRLEAYGAPTALRPVMFRAFAGVLGGVGTGQRGRPKGSGYGGGYGMNQLSAGPTEAECQAAAAAAERSIGGRMVDEWMEWITQQEQQSSGFRRPLGLDYRGRHYWVLGGAAGAWRVFVEEQEGARWGYYEGQQVLQLISWLACAAIESEVPLLHTLCTMPWPYRPSLVLTAVSSAATAAAAAAGAEPPTSQGSIAYWANVASGGGAGGSGGSSYSFGYCFTPLEAGVEALGPLVMAVGVRVPDASQLMGSRQMQRLRPDGYRKLAAPLMLGEAGVPGGSVLGSGEERVSAAIASLVAVLPFWLRQQQQHILQQLGNVVDEALVADSPSAFCRVLLTLESLLSDPHVQPAPLRPTWTSSWQQAWRDSLTASGPGSWEAIMLHLAMLGRFAVVDEFSLSRNTFLRIVTNSRCPALFPAVGDTFMFVRSGCLRHLEKYSQLPPRATAPLPPAADELTATAAAIKQLPPVSCYKVIALAYCSYPMPDGLKQQQQQVAAAAAADAAATDGADGVDAVAGGDSGAASAGGSLLGPGHGGTAAAAASEPGGSDDWPGLAALGDDGVEEIDSLLNFDIDELDIDSLPGQMHQQQHQNHQQQHQHQGQEQKQQQQQGSAEQQQQQQQQPATGDGHGPGQEPTRSSPPTFTGTDGAPEYRPPCMWALMSPQDLSSSRTAAPGDPAWQQPGTAPASVRDGKRPYIAVPFHVDANLPDYLVTVSAYEACMERSWLPGDKFSMYFGGSQGQKGGGQYYKGIIMSVDEPLEGEEADPWCSIEVLWDNNDDSSSHTAKNKVSPWDIETDRDEARKAEEAARRQQQAAAAAEELRRQEEAAAEARARRRASRTVADYSDLIGAADDDDEYNPLAEGYSSDSDDGRRRRGRRGKRGRGSDDEDFRETAVAAGGGKKSKSKASAPTGGMQWSAEQIKQQQSTHLPPKQQQMLGAMATGNTLLLARLTSAPPNAPIHQQPFPLPLKPGVLCALPNADSFIALVGDYISSANRNFSRPVWGQRELDLYTMFMVVNVRGGYEAVCRTNRWEDVCRSMGIAPDPSSGSNMRTHYEKCLVEFEQYIRCGRFEQDMEAGKPPTAQKADTDAAFEQVMRAGAAAAAAPPPPPPAPPAPRASSVAVAGVGLRPQLIAGAAGGMLQMPGVAGLQPGTTAFLARNAAGQPVVIQATPQQLLALQLAQQQQQQLLLAKQHGRVGAGAAPVVLPAGVPAVSGAANTPAASAATAPAAAAATAAAQQQLLLRQQLLQQAQLQSAAAAAGAKVLPTAGTAAAAAANPQFKALLQQQTAALRPGVAAPVQLAGGLTLQQLQALQAQQLKNAGVISGSAGQGPKVAVSSGGVAPAAGLGLPPRPPAPSGTAAAAPATSSAGAQNALAGTGSMNFSALLDDL